MKVKKGAIVVSIAPYDLDQYEAMGFKAVKEKPEPEKKEKPKAAKKEAPKKKKKKK